MTHHRVLVIAQDSLFRNGIESSLSGQPDMTIIGVVPADINVIAAEIRRANPSAIIIDSADTEENSSLLLHLLNVYPSIRLIGLSLATNRINIYNKREVCITAISDLVTAITGEP